jgi:PEGA domain
MTLKRRALFVFAACILLACAACSPASNNNSAAGNANVTNRPTANANTANANAAPKSKPGTGSIEVVSLPAGAGVTLVPTTEDSASTPQAYGATPATINDLAPGKYLVNVSKPGYKDFRKEVEVKADATVRVKAALKQ